MKSPSSNLKDIDDFALSHYVSGMFERTAGTISSLFSTSLALASLLCFIGFPSSFYAWILPAFLVGFFVGGCSLVLENGKIRWVNLLYFEYSCEILFKHGRVGSLTSGGGFFKKMFFQLVAFTSFFPKSSLISLMLLQSVGLLVLVEFHSVQWKPFNFLNISEGRFLNLPWGTVLLSLSCASLEGLILGIYVRRLRTIVSRLISEFFEDNVDTGG